jgi:hypothetical protein
MEVSILSSSAEGSLSSPKASGALALVGAWREVEDVDMDSLVVDIYGQREKDMGRSVELEN